MINRWISISITLLLVQGPGARFEKTLHAQAEPGSFLINQKSHGHLQFIIGR